MCGKFTQLASWADVVRFSAPLTLAPNDAVVVSTPMRFASVIRLNDAGQREVEQMRWGFADMRAQNPAKPAHMHVRSETIDERPTFADAFAHRRGILVVSTFNEGEELESGKTKQWVISPKDGEPIAMAVIYEEWRNADEELFTFVLVTVPPNPLIARVTDRMPAMLKPEDWSLWLGETPAPLAHVKALLRTYDDGGNWDMREQNPRMPSPQGDLFS